MSNNCNVWILFEQIIKTIFMKQLGKRELTRYLMTVRRQFSYEMVL